MDFISKSLVKVSYANQADLNLVASDFDDNMIEISPDGDFVKRLKTATGTIASPEIFGPVSVTFHIKKTSPQYSAYKSRVVSNTVIPGQADVYDDAGQHYTLTQLSLKPMAFNASGNDASVPFVLQGNMLINNDLIAQLIG